MTEKLQDLCRHWLQAKADEKAANKRRLEIELEIVKLTGTRDEGSKTVNLDKYKVKVTGKVTRSFDWDKWENIKAKIPQNLWPVRTKTELDETGVKYLRDNEVEIYQLLPLSVKPAKTAIEVELVAEE